MLIKQHPISGIWCREDGAVLMKPSCKFPKYRWVFGTAHRGYRTIRYNHGFYRVHRLICEAFHGHAPINKPFVDHINSIRHERLHRCLGLATICDIKQRCAITNSRKVHFCKRKNKLLAYANLLKIESAG